jgi:NAD(P)-dependent dehydrogenase (short-subunit alcohol dehydrogenase family)
MDRRFEGKIALVTGGGRGIGEAASRRLAAEGAAVGVVDFDAGVAKAVAAGIREAGGTASAFQCDVRDIGSAEATVAAVVAEFGGLDVLVSNAGIQRYGTVETTTMQDWDDVIATNLKGPFLMARFAVAHIRQRGGGAIVNTASVQAFATQESVVAYSASKGGLVTMTKTMALDHAREQIRVNAIAPGSVRTPMLEWGATQFRPDDPESAIAEWGRNHPLGTVIDPADVASLIAFLASDEARAITGATYLVDAGLLAGLAV